MSVIIILLVILMFLMAFIGDEKGLNSFFVFISNFALMYFIFVKISNSSNPILLTLFFCVIMSAFTLFLLNGFHIKTAMAFLSVIIVILIMFIFICIFSFPLNIQGFDLNQSESIEYLSTNVNVSFQNIIICEILIAVFSAISDTAMTISSSMNEIYLINPEISRKNLYKSGMNIGSDILGTTVNTLFFVYFGNLLIILIWFKFGGLDTAYIINSKMIAQIVFDIIISGISVILVIPITALITSKALLKKVDNN